MIHHVTVTYLFFNLSDIIGAHKVIRTSICSVLWM